MSMVRNRVKKMDCDHTPKAVRFQGNLHKVLDNTIPLQRETTVQITKAKSVVGAPLPTHDWLLLFGRKAVEFLPNNKMSWNIIVLKAKAVKNPLT